MVGECASLMTLGHRVPAVPRGTDPSFRINEKKRPPRVKNVCLGVSKFALFFEWGICCRLVNILRNFEYAAAYAAYVVISDIYRVVYMCIF